jgi:lipopolysaccharide biosynthesis protein
MWRRLPSSETKLPHPLFSIEYYLSRNPGIRRTNIDPLRHFVARGWAEGRNPHPLFDVRFYCAQVDRFDQLGLDPVTHYLEFGWKAGLKPHRLFDPRWYLSQYSDVAAMGSEPLTHYLRTGWREGREPWPAFDAKAYRNNSDLAEGENPLVHYLLRNGDEAINDLVRSTSGLDDVADLDEAADLSNTIDLDAWKIGVSLKHEGQLVLDKPIGIFVHLYYDGVADEVASYLARIHLPKNIYVSTDTEEKKKWIQHAFDQYGVGAEVEIAIVPNCGFDIAPMLVGFSDKIRQHDICLKIHGKKSSHNAPEFGEAWRAFLYDHLARNTDHVNAIVRSFIDNPALGAMIPEHYPALHAWVGIGKNYAEMKNLLGRIDVSIRRSQPIEFPSGSMFWFRSAAIAPLLDLNLNWGDFGLGANRDETLAHAVERSFLFFCAKAGFNWAVIPQPPGGQDLSREATIRVILESGAFDEAYYLGAYSDIKKSDIDPLVHFVDHGADEGRNPSAAFDTKYYTRFLRATSESRINPLAHYILYGRARGLRPKRADRVPGTITVDNLYSAYRRAERGADYVREARPIIRDTDVKVVAFYFPQFHPFAENDKFWGRGFTEWTNTTKTMAMYHGHYQPRLPGELGFYDTRLKQVLARQIELAKQYGIHGFCLHHYFFDGKPVMHVPYDLIMANPDLDIPFCLHWANEPWTVRWDGLTSQSGVLLNQSHSSEDNIAFIRYIEPALRDRRYIRIGDRPVLIIYRPGLFPDIRAAIEQWRDYCHRAGVADPYLVMMHTAFDGPVDPRAYGFDAAIEYPPHNLGAPAVTNRLRFFDPGFEGQVYDYEHIVDRGLARSCPDYTLFRGIMPDWDCTPRRANPDLFINSAPHRYQHWLEGLCRYTEEHHSRDEQLIFVNAWNEWAEGAYLEPDRRFGYAYLEATARALNGYKPCDLNALKMRVLVGAHIFYVDLLDEFIDHFKKVPGAFDLVVTVAADKGDEVGARLEERLGDKIGSLSVVPVENVGRDFAPFLFHFLPRTAAYDVCCWVHSKKSVYESAYHGWRSYLLRNLLGSDQAIFAIVEQFAHDADLGLVYPAPYEAVTGGVEWGSNFELTQSLLARLGITIEKEMQPIFPTAAMFWFRPIALQGLLDLGLTRDDFVCYGEGPRDPNSGSIVDGTISHALERMICYVAENAGYRFKEILFES